MIVELFHNREKKRGIKVRKMRNNKEITRWKRENSKEIRKIRRKKRYIVFRE